MNETDNYRENATEGRVIFDALIASPTAFLISVPKRTIVPTHDLQTQSS